MAPRSRNPIDEDLEARAADRDDDDDDGEELDGEDPEGDDDDDGDDAEDLGDSELTGARIGDPFAMSSDVELVEAYAVVQHEDGKKFRVNLLTDRPKVSPHTQQRYTHVLVIAPEDDDAIVGDVIRHVMQANGTSPEELMQGDRKPAAGRKPGGDIPEG